MPGSDTWQGPERRKAPRRVLSAEERRLWRQIMNQVTPMREVLEDDEWQEAPESVFSAPGAVNPPKLRAASASGPVTLLERGQYAGVDRATANRLHRGRMAIEKRLDLHGLNRSEAHIALIRFVEQAYAEHRRCLLVITGKGQRSPETHGERAGVLKSLLPLWLNEPGMRKLLLAYDHATREHGGDGAFYLLLKRRRDVGGA